MGALSSTSPDGTLEPGSKPHAGHLVAPSGTTFLPHPGQLRRRTVIRSSLQSLGLEFVRLLDANNSLVGFLTDERDSFASFRDRVCKRHDSFSYRRLLAALFTFDKGVFVLIEQRFEWFGGHVLYS